MERENRRNSQNYYINPVKVILFPQVAEKSEFPSCQMLELSSHQREWTEIYI